MAQSASPKTQFAIRSYEIHELIGEGAKGYVYRCSKDGQSYAIKILKTPPGELSLESIHLFQKETATVARLQHPNLVRIFDFGESDQQLFLVMELAEGISLSDHFTKGPLTVEESLSIGSAVASALTEVHSHGLIHQDLKPENIIINPSGDIKLIDFGLGGEINPDSSSDGQRHDFQGTLNYAAPEQVGVIKRLIDGRSDLYALGVTLYQLMTGRLPIDGATTSDFLQALATKIPTPIADLKPQVPQVISKIIAKLLAKDPDDRYQTAAGLKYDLDHASTITELGTRDLASNRSYQMPLFGRDEELAKLRNEYSIALKGQGRVVTVEGDGGLGKSRLTRELLKDAQEAGITTLISKCNQLEMDKPLASFQQAFDKLIYDLQRKPTALQDHVTEKIRAAAQGKEGSLSSFSEGLKSLLESPSVEISSDRLRFLNQTSEFICDLANQLGGIVFLIDDVQWLDEVSRSLFHALSQRLNDSKLLVLASSRNDKPSRHGLAQFKDATERSRTLSLEIGPLQQQAIHQFVQSFLGGRDISESIVERLMGLSEGNPFILTEYLNNLLSSGALSIINGAWDLDQKALSTLNLSQNVYDLVLRRISDLPPTVKTVLSVAALLGTSFDAGTLAQIVQKPVQEIRDLLSLAARHRIVEVNDSSQFSLVHDRVREALVSDLTDEEKNGLHDQVADILESEVEQNPDKIFALARHSSLGNIERNPLRAFKANMDAADRALKAYAAHDANEFARISQGLVSQLSLTPAIEYRFWRLFGSVKSALGQYREAKEFFGIAFTFAKTDIESAYLYFYLGQVQLNEGNYDESFATLKQSLKKCGYRYPKSLPGTVGHIVIFLIFGYFVNLTNWGYGSLKRVNQSKRRERYNLILSSFEIIGILTYLHAMTIDSILAGVAANFYSHFIGDSAESIRGQVYLANLTATLGFNKASIYHLKIVEQIAGRMNSKSIRIWAKKLSSMAYMFQGDMAKSLAISNETIDEMIKQAPPLDVALHTGDHIFQLMQLGRVQEALERWRHYVIKVDEVNVKMLMWSMRSMASFALQLLGQTHESVKVFEEAEKIKGSLGHDLPFISCRSFGNKFVQRFEEGELSNDLDELIAGYESYKLKDYHSRAYYFYSAYIREWQTEAAKTASERDNYLKLYKKVVAANEKRAVTPLWKSHHASSKAGLMRILGRFDQAEKILREGSIQARIINSATVDYYMLKEKARLALAQGLNADSKNYIQQAYDLCQERGWPVRKRRLVEEFGFKEPVQAPARSTTSGSHTTTGGPLDSNRTINALLRVSLASSLGMDLNKQVQSSLNELVSVVGAERGYVFLTEGDGEELKFSGGRGSSGEVLDEPKEYSATLVRKVADTKEPMVVAGSDEMEAIGSKSAVIHGLRSIMAVPLLLRGELRGVVYVDSSLAKGLFSQGDVEVFSAIANHIAIAFENVRIMNVESAKREMQKDLELSAAVQQMLLPKTADVQAEHYCLSGYYRSAVQCGGDWWWYEQRPDGKLWLFVGDVTGHGAGPAMITSSVAACFAYEALQDRENSLPDIVTKVSHTLYQITAAKYLMSAVAMEFDPQTRKLRVWNAGGPGVFVFRANGQTEVLGKPSSAMGFTEFTLEEETIDLSPNDRLFVPTDGILETVDAKGKRIRERTIMEMALRVRPLNTTQACTQFIEELDQKRGSSPQDDDLTLLIVDIAS